MIWNLIIGSVLIISFITALVVPSISYAQIPNRSFSQTAIIESKPADIRVIILRDYLAKYNSPLKNNSRDFIESADKHGVDWRLVASIAGVESTFGKRIPGGYNGWGWGVYGTQALYFKSWKDGIYTVTKGLKENYIDDGLVTPHQINRRYAASKTWGNKVTYFMEDLEKFARNYPEYRFNNQTIDRSNAEAGSSAKVS